MKKFYFISTLITVVLMSAGYVGYRSASRVISGLPPEKLLVGSINSEGIRQFNLTWNTVDMKNGTAYSSADRKLSRDDAAIIDRVVDEAKMLFKSSDTDLKLYIVTPKDKAIIKRYFNENQYDGTSYDLEGMVVYPYIYIFINNSGDSMSKYIEPLSHELTHRLLKINGPEYILEGAATYYGMKMDEAIGGNKFKYKFLYPENLKSMKTFDEIAEGSEDPAVLYGGGMSVISFMAQKLGEDKLAGQLTVPKDEESFMAYMAGFESEWVEYLKTLTYTEKGHMEKSKVKR